MEIGNNVFMEYRKTAQGFEKLAQQNVDFGGGLERLIAAKQNSPDMFLIDIFDGIRHRIEKLSGKKYGEDSSDTYAFRIVMDHMRAATFLIADGVLPSNTDQGYVLRRLLRRAIRFSDMLGIQLSLSECVEDIVAQYGGAYDVLSEKKKEITDTIDREEMRFRETLVRGMKALEKRLETGVLTGKDAFELFSTYGFPFELTLELAKEKGVAIDETAFRAEMSRHQDLSRSGAEQKFKGGLADAGEQTVMLHTSTHLMLAGLRKYLGDHIHQAGSNITAERTRFDFTHPEKVPRETLDKVEAYVNEAIAKGCRVTIEQMPKDEAKKAGVEGSFWEKYPEIVNVYVVRAPDGTVYSQELCGGPHVADTGAIAGTFRIIKEEASSAGVRRIKAILE
jgi:alanyl-tRNA synthetase